MRASPGLPSSQRMERLMHYVWQYRLIPADSLVTVDGRRITVLDTGRHNTDAGPDFFNAKIRIGDRIWAGDIEIHVRASDWHRHNHDGDPAYDSVILHVVDSDDQPIRRANGEVIPQMTMQCSPQFHQRYSRLVDRSDIDLPCASEIPAIHPLHLNSWIAALAYERAYAKADSLLSLLDTLSGDWEQATYITLARALGFSINSEPMQRLARSMPLPFLRKHSDSLTSVEALLFGQAGLLPSTPGADSYTARLISEYTFLAHKFSLHPLTSPGWKMGRMRPANLPHRRIATLASYIAGDFRIVRRLLDADTPETAITLLRTPLTGYWASHYTFSTPSADSEQTSVAMSRNAAIILVINVAVPLLIAYGTRHGDEPMTRRAFEWLQQLPPESNSIISRFATAGIRSRDAFTTQALIQLRRRYCETHSCLYCRIGHRLLTARAQR